MPFPVPTGRRLAYDSDGSQVYEYNPTTGVSYRYTTAQMKQLNSDVGSAIFGNGSYGVPDTGGTLYELIFFPGARDIQAARYWMQADNSNSSTMYYSTDTTGPGTGTWNPISGTNTTPNHTNSINTVSVDYRSPIAATIAGVKGIMVPWATRNNFAWIGQIHVYGTRSASDTNRQVAFVDSTGARFTKDFDFEDIKAGAQVKWKSPTLFSATDQLYLKNFGAQTANSVVVSLEVSGSDTGNLTKLPSEASLSLDDVTYTATETFATIAPGAIVGPLFVEYSSLTNDPISLGIGRMKITIGSWT